MHVRRCAPRLNSFALFELPRLMDSETLLWQFELRTQKYLTDSSVYFCPASADCSSILRKVDVHLAVQRSVAAGQSAEVVVFAGKNILRREVRSTDSESDICLCSRFVCVTTSDWSRLKSICISLYIVGKCTSPSTKWRKRYVYFVVSCRHIGGTLLTSGFETLFGCSCRFAHQIGRTLRKFKERKEGKDHKTPEFPVPSVFVDVRDEDFEDMDYAFSGVAQGTDTTVGTAIPQVDNVVKRKTFPVTEQSVEEAILCLEYLDHDFYLVRVRVLSVGPCLCCREVVL